MRLKVQPDDFQVDEVSRPPPEDPRGAYQVFRVEKRGVEALEAMHAIARALGVTPHDVAFAGLKDQRSRAVQLATVRLERRALPKRLSAGPGIDLEPLGRAGRAISGE